MCVLPSYFDLSKSVQGGINFAIVIKAAKAAVKIRQADSVRIEENQLRMGNVMVKPGSVAKEIIFLAVEKKS